MASGTVCITIAANIAETALLTFDACFPDSVVGFLADKERIDSSYVEFFLRTARAELEAFAPATARKNINLFALITNSNWLEKMTFIVSLGPGRKPDFVASSERRKLCRQDDHLRLDRRS